jgi:hypothetical protein
LTISSDLNDDNSGVSLNLQWHEPVPPLFDRERRLSWLDEKKLREIGFDTSVAAADQRAAEFYGRQRARSAFVALEYDGPAWRTYLEDAQRAGQQQAEVFAGGLRARSGDAETHLVAIDAGPDPVALRARHPDRHSVIIVPAVARIGVQPAIPALASRSPTAASIFGAIQEIQSSIHVPRPFSDAFRRLPKDRSSVKYRVHVLYGASYEPWIAGVEFTAPPGP